MTVRNDGNHILWPLQWPHLRSVEHLREILDWHVRQGFHHHHQNTTQGLPFGRMVFIPPVELMSRCTEAVLVVAQHLTETFCVGLSFHLSPGILSLNPVLSFCCQAMGQLPINKAVHIHTHCLVRGLPSVQLLKASERNLKQPIHVSWMYKEQIYDSLTIKWLKVIIFLRLSQLGSENGQLAALQWRCKDST